MTADFRLLGPMEAYVDGDPVEPGHSRQRCVLTVLLVEINRAVSADQLLDRVWGERPPHRARNVLSGYLSRLRQVLAPSDEVRISRTPEGYVLAADPMVVDVHRFRRLVADARTVDQRTAAELLTQAVGQWRGEPFATFDTPWFNEVREALKAERYAAELERNDLALQSGDHATVLSDIAASAELHPLDERLTGQLMLALYQSGRQDQALAAFRTIRHHLVEELGADPGPPLRRLHQQILDGDPALTAHPAGRSTGGQTRPPVPRQLPAPPPAFAGRDRELAELDALLAAVDQRPNTVVISALSGTGGVGKTALALQWARQVAHRFPDGQLYVNLRGFDPSGSMMAPGEAVRGFLEALDVSPQRMPTSVDAQAGLYRSLLADRRILVVLDNARDVQQLRPLLPGAPGCLVLVTSRNRLTGLVATEGAVPLSLDLLRPDEAFTMLAERLGADRLDDEPRATDEIITFCGRLPLALAIVAARAAAQRDLPLAALTEKLRDVRDRLDALDVGDRSTDVRAVFSWSYAALDPESARTFRLLGLHPGPDFGSRAAAGLIDRSTRQAAAALTELSAANLLGEHQPGRFSFHDLLRAYAAELAEDHDTVDDRTAARQRMFDHYLHTADRADHLLYPHRDPVALPTPSPDIVDERLADATQALEWFSREGPVLLAVARLAESLGHSTFPGHLTWTMVNFLDRRGQWPDWVDVQVGALRAAVNSSDLRGQVTAHRGLEHAYLQLGRYDDADRHGHCALELYRLLDDPAGEAQTHLALGVAATRRGELDAALTLFLRACTLYESVGHRSGRANALNNAGMLQTMRGDFDEAVALCEEAVEIQRTIGDRYMLGNIWDSLGYAHQHLGHHQQAISCYRSALELLREQGDRCFEAETLTHLGDTHALAGDEERARDAWQAAVHIYEELGHPDAETTRAKLAAPPA